MLILDDESIWLVETVDQVDSSLCLPTEDAFVIDAQHPVAGGRIVVNVPAIASLVAF
jgi:hypothetical protein